MGCRRAEQSRGTRHIFLSSFCALSFAFAIHPSFFLSFFLSFFMCLSLRVSWTLPQRWTSGGVTRRLWGKGHGGPQRCTKPIRTCWRSKAGGLNLLPKLNKIEVQYPFVNSHGHSGSAVLDLLRALHPLTLLYKGFCAQFYRGTQVQIKKQKQKQIKQCPFFTLIFSRY